MNKKNIITLLSILAMLSILACGTSSPQGSEPTAPAPQPVTDQAADPTDPIVNQQDAQQQPDQANAAAPSPVTNPAATAVPAPQETAGPASDIPDSSSQNVQGADVPPATADQAIPNSEATAEPPPEPIPFWGSEETDREVLVELYNSTGGDNWINSENWLSDRPIREWYGVETGTTRVSGLDLAANGLSGNLPETFWFLNELQKLYLEDNSLSGEIPPLAPTGDARYVERLKLERIDLTGNQFSTCIPLFIINSIPQENAYYGSNEPCPSPDQEALEAMYNALGGPDWPNQENWLTEAPISEWHGVSTGPDGRVTTLQLYNNKLKGQLPPEIGQLEMLESLTLSNSPPAPPAGIDYIATTARQETGSLEVILNDLETANRLTGELPPEFGSLKNLKKLEMKFAGLTGPLPQVITELDSLETLNLSYNEFSENIPPEYGKLTNLKWLNLLGNTLTGPIPPELGDMKNLTGLNLATNKLSGPIPPELTAMESLHDLNLSRNLLTGEIPPSIGSMESLYTLNLSANKLTGEIPRQLGNSQDLDTLILSGNMLSGSLPRQLGKLNLRDVQIQYNQLTGNIPEEILENLVGYWNITGNQFTGCIPARAKNLFEDHGFPQQLETC